MIDVSVWRAEALVLRGAKSANYCRNAPLEKQMGELIWEVAQPVFWWAAARGIAPRGEEFQNRSTLNLERSFDFFRVASLMQPPKHT